MEVANASMYDGSSAVPEAAMMAVRVARRDKILIARTVHPEYREVLGTYTKHQGIPVEELAYGKNGRLDLDDLKKKLDESIAAVILQTPNFFGILEQVPEISRIVQSKGALLVVVFTEAVALGLIEPPRDADIVVGELQSFAISPSYGGPYAGIIATREKYIRQIPGRLVGETTDAQGRRAFCLTLATREQHIRREKATSNICTNQALLALMATVFMTLYGKEGLRELAEQNLAKAHYLADKLPLAFEAPFFNEFVVRANGKSPEAINSELLQKKIIGGLELGRFYPELKNCMLLCATEMSKRQDMDTVAAAFVKH
jgi:glycine dehydrogenase subunit 1